MKNFPFPFRPTDVWTMLLLGSLLVVAGLAVAVFVAAWVGPVTWFMHADRRHAKSKQGVPVEAHRDD